MSKLRQGSYFPGFFEAHKTSKQALVAVIREAWISGLSTHRVDDLLQAMGLSGISKSTVSKLCVRLGPPTIGDHKAHHPARQWRRGRGRRRQRISSTRGGCLAPSAAACRAWPSVLATLQRISPSKPRRDEDELREVARSASPFHRMARDFDRQIAEVQVCAAVLNRFTALGIPFTTVVG